MNRITQLFQTKKRDILSVYFTAGYPHRDDTPRLLKAIENNGIDMVEIGIPFSDPIADGTLIQEASTQALCNGMSLRLLFCQLKAIRREVNIPILLMGYLNPIMRYGFPAFCRECATVGIDGLIIPDLPFGEYIKTYKKEADQYDLKMSMLITPETSEARIREIDAQTDGFIYMVSSAATTGEQETFDEERRSYFQRIDAMQLKHPRLIGFGISNKTTFEMATSYSEGAIIGSRFIRLLQSEPTPEAAVKRLVDIIRN